MTNRINPNIVNAIDPPIDEANSWLVGRTFTDEKPLLNLAQAVPSYAPSKDLTNFMAERVKLFETAQYGPVSGNDNLKTELANHMNGIYGGSIYHDNILISAGCILHLPPWWYAKHYSFDAASGGSMDDTTICRISLA